MEAIARVEGVVRASTASFYASVFEVFDVTLAPGFGYEDLAAVSSLVMDGFLLRARTDAAIATRTVTVPGIDGEPVEWPLVAHTLRSVVLGVICDARISASAA
jgi:hypothetical protein